MGLGNVRYSRLQRTRLSSPRATARFSAAGFIASTLDFANNSRLVAIWTVLKTW